jgi:chromosome segregation ATPase
MECVQYSKKQRLKQFEPRMIYSLKQAAEATGKSKATVLRALQGGKISGKKDESGEWKIDPAELHRVFPPSQKGTSCTIADKPHEIIALQREIAILREERDRERRQLQDTIDDLRHRLDEAEGERRRVQAQMISLVTDRRSFWQRLKGGPPER